MKRLTTLGILLAALAVTAAAERPFHTDDPYVVGLYHWERTAGIEILTGSWENIRSRNQAFIPLSVDYGVTMKSEIGAELDVYQYNDPGRSGFGDGYIHYKHLFWEHTPSNPDISLDFKLKVPTGSRSRGLGSGKPDLGIASLYGWDVDRWRTTAELAYTFVGSSSDRNFWDFGVATRYRASYNVLLLGEIYFNRNKKPGEPSIVDISGGLGYEFDPQTTWDIFITAGCSQSTPDLGIRTGIRSVL